MVTQNQILEYLNELTNVHIKEYAERYPNLKPPTFSITVGKKFLRVVRTDGLNRSQSVHCFLDWDGNIYKAASWKARAKGVRGNILNEKKPLKGYDYYK